VLFLFTALGCALGGVVRYLCMLGLSHWLGEAFPWGTLCVNLLGSCLLGALMGTDMISAGNSGGLREPLHAVTAIGFCGGLTTFSTFSLQNLSLLSSGSRAKLAASIAANVLLCLAAAAAGYACMERWGA